MVGDPVGEQLGGADRAEMGAETTARVWGETTPEPKRSPSDIRSGLDYASMVRFTLDVLRPRVQRWVLLGMTFGLWVYASMVPDRPRIAVVVLFTALVFLPVWWKRD